MEGQRLVLRKRMKPLQNAMTDRGKLVQRQLHCIFLHELLQPTQTDLGDKCTVIVADAIIADI